jgi:hypothetical protein
VLHLLKFSNRIEILRKDLLNELLSFFIETIKPFIVKLTPESLDIPGFGE